ncbi:MAG: hypothetical protein WBA31_03555 [Candidatus Dormiibacterota bacterium]
MSAGPEDRDPQPDALAAAAEAFAAARSARRLLDTAGRRGAVAVNQSRPIPGARRASAKAQASLEESAHKLEEARDRWAALMRGIAVDMSIAPEDLVQRVESYALGLALDDLESSLLACRDAAAALGQDVSQALETARTAIRLMRPNSGSEGSTAKDRPASSK